MTVHKSISGFDPGPSVVGAPDVPALEAAVDRAWAWHEAWDAARKRAEAVEDEWFDEHPDVDYDTARHMRRRSDAASDHADDAEDRLLFAVDAWQRAKRGR